MGHCAICGCEAELTKHHLVPKSKAKNKYREIRDDESNLAWVCRTCHDQIHALYSESELRDRLSTLDALLNDEKLKAFADWKRKHPGFEGSSKMSNRRKSRA